MKKQLLAGTAFVAAAMLVAGGAMAQDKMKKKMMKPSISVAATPRRSLAASSTKAWIPLSRTHPRST